MPPCGGSFAFAGRRGAASVFAPPRCVRSAIWPDARGVASFRHAWQRNAQTPWHLTPAAPSLARPGSFLEDQALSLGVQPDETGAEQGNSTLGTGRGASGRFPPGASGNPKGRPKGSRDKRTLALAELLDGGGEAIVKKLVALATKGRPWAVRLVVDRIVPKLDRRVEIELPRVDRAGDVAAAVAEVIACAAAGSLSIEEARGFLQLLEQQRKAIETSELAVKLEVLQESVNAQQQRGEYD